MSSLIYSPGDEVPNTGDWTFVETWSTECGWIHLRKGWFFPVIHHHRQYRYFLRGNAQAAAQILRLAA